MPDLSRAVLKALLVRWYRNEVDARFVHEKAEAIFEAAGAWPELPETDPRAIEIEVLEQLEILNHSLITRTDVPALVEFLDTPRGSELEAWSAWQRYVDAIDFDARERARGDSFYVVT